MKNNILVSLGLVVVAGVAAVAVGTGAIFSDTETSQGNTFTAGAIDLTVDSQCTYNGVPSTECGTWQLKDLNPTADKFFNFVDVKPGDQGENTLSLHVISNEAKACLVVDKMQNNDLTLTESESELDTTVGAGKGELANEVYFFAWADDGDNIWESGETPLFSNTYGPASDVLNGKAYYLGTIAPDVTNYVGVYWCYGAMTVNSTNNTLSCSGSAVTNATQTDQMFADVWFYVEQARNNPNFVCPSPRSNITVTEGYPQFTHSGGVRYKSLATTGSRELYLGVQDLGNGANRVESDYVWSSPSSHPFEFTFDKVTDKLVGKIGATTLEYPNFSTKLTGGCTVANLNKVQMTVAARHTGTSVDVKNLDLDGNALGNYGAVYSQFKDWTIAGYNFADGFTLKGTIDLAGTFAGGDELSKVQFLVGCAL